MKGKFEYFDGESHEYLCAPIENGLEYEEYLLECEGLPYKVYIKELRDEGAMESRTFDFPFVCLEKIYTMKDEPEKDGIYEVDFSQCLLEHFFSYLSIKDWFYGEFKKEKRDKAGIKDLSELVDDFVECQEKFQTVDDINEDNISEYLQKVMNMKKFFDSF